MTPGRPFRASMTVACSFASTKGFAWTGKDADSRAAGTALVRRLIAAR